MTHRDLHNEEEFKIRANKTGTQLLHMKSVCLDGTLTPLN